MINKISIGGVGGQHDIDVGNAFVQGYNSAGGNWNGVIIQLGAYSFSSNIEQARINGSQIYIRSTTGLTSFISIARNYYPDINCFVPAGSNSPGEVFESNGGQNLPSIVVTGAGDYNNETADDIEFFAPDIITGEPDFSSYANGYIAGQLAYIANTLNVNIWTARYLARQTGSQNGIWHEVNGYGLINIQEAINAYDPDFNYNILDPFIPHIGQITELKLYNSVDINFLDFASVNNAQQYEIWRSFNGGNFELINTINQTGYYDTVGWGKNEYKIRGKMLNEFNEIEYTEFSNVVEFCRQKLKYFVITNVN